MARLAHTSFMDLAVVAKEAGYNSSKIAQRLGISERHLRRHIRSSLGCSLREWLDERRLTDAVSLLRTNKTFKEVAHDLGFKQQSHFTRKFKERYGMNPSEFSGMYARVWGHRTS